VNVKQINFLKATIVEVAIKMLELLTQIDYGR
jgi:hypothetical protein